MSALCNSIVTVHGVSHMKIESRELAGCDGTICTSIHIYDGKGAELIQVKMFQTTK